MNISLIWQNYYSVKMQFSRYLIATQDRDLQDAIRNVPGTPLLYLHGNAPALEPPSKLTIENAKQNRSGVGISNFETETVKTLKKQCGLETEEVEKRVKKKRRKGGPNPLSCKKKAKKTIEPVATTSGKVRKRKKVKLSAHAKEILQSVKSGHSTNDN